MSSDNRSAAGSSSIRRRITAFYAGVLVLVVLAAALVLFFASETHIRHTARQDLIDAVENGFDEISYHNGVITINEDYDTYYRGVTLILYAEDGSRIKGNLPHDFPGEVVLESGEYKDVQGDGETWLVYDAYRTYENGKMLWIRGIYNMENRSGATSHMGWIIIAMLPLILLLALYAGNRITKQALRPVAELTDTAKRISGGDLSERVPVSDRRDELQSLALTFNDMLERLETAFESEKQFSADAAHELKTPVATILAECEFARKQGEHLAQEGGDAAPVYQESLEQIEAQCRRMMALITQLLQLSRSMNTADLLEKETIDLSLLCEETAEELQASAAERGVKIETDIEEGILFEGDETLLMRLLINLLNNAVKYSKAAAGDAQCDSFAKVSLHRNDDSIILSVRDNGIGIAPEDQEKVFHRLYKVDSARSFDGNSFGIGLSMVQWIAAAHGGQVTLTSALGEGSTFVVSLPVNGV